MPTLVIWGKQDNFISPRHAEVLQRLFANIQVTPMINADTCRKSATRPGEAYVVTATLPEREFLDRCGQL
jgi:hypothetical protein